MEVLVKDQRIVHINGCGHGLLRNSNLKSYLIPDQSIPDEWWDKEGRFVGAIKWPSDLVQYAVGELHETPAEAREALRARGPAIGEKTLSDLRERIALIERALGLK